jgi:hypothetical protein
MREDAGLLVIVEHHQVGSAPFAPERLRRRGAGQQSQEEGG